MDESRNTIYLLTDPDFLRTVRDQIRYESEFETPVKQRTWIIVYFFLAVVLCFVPMLVAVAILDAPKKNEPLEFFLHSAAITFIGVGIFSFVQGVLALRKKKVTDTLRKQYPTKPWKWRMDWAQGIICNKKGNSSVWIIAILYNLILTPTMIMAIATNNYRFILKYGLQIFVALAAGIAFFVYALMNTLRANKFGTSICQPSIMPIKPGVEVQYVIRIPTRLVGINKIQSRIFCFRSQKIDPGKQQIGSGKKNNEMCHMKCNGKKSRKFLHNRYESTTLRRSSPWHTHSNRMFNRR